MYMTLSKTYATAKSGGGGIASSGKNMSSEVTQTGSTNHGSRKSSVGSVHNNNYRGVTSAMRNNHLNLIESNVYSGWSNLS